MIKFIDAVKSYDGTTALDGLNMEVPKGSVYGLVGPNGAGKTTAIRHVTGVLKQDSGRVLVDNEPIFENNRVKAEIASIPDEVFFFSQASTADMKRFYRSVYPSFSEERYSELSKAMPLDDNAPMRKLSRGMQKQAAFRLALSLRPELLVLDEPVDGLDPIMRRQVLSLVMEDVADRNMTVLISSHNLRELEDICSHVGMMSRGKLLLERSLAELQDNIVKILVALPEGKSLPDGLDILHESRSGRLLTLIVRGDREEITCKIRKAGPQFLDAVPLSLEEIFIYELGGDGYALKDIIL